MKKYIERSKNFIQSDVDYLVENYAFDEGVARLFSSRGVTALNCDAFFDFSYENFHDPLLLDGMGKAVELIKNVMRNSGSILICGDYDADGLTATAILKLFFANNGIDADTIIPTRDTGYGLHFETVAEAFNSKHYDLIITVDCGISNKDEIDQILSSFDTTVIVTDHHEPPSVLPDCVCVNPKLGDYPCKYLSGAGVAFKVVEALVGIEDAELYADLATVGTVADMMLLVDENRDIVKLGLSSFRHKGLLALANASNCSKDITCADVALRIAPKINAAGRIGNPEIALDLLLMQSAVTQAAVVKLLDTNIQRRALLDEAVKDAETKVNDNMNGQMIFMTGSWPKGLLGIIANRFKESYSVPSVFLTADGDNFVGSARSNENFNLFETFTSVSDCLVKYGGHKSSVGFTVSANHLELLRSKLQEVIATDQKQSQPCVTYDLEYNEKYLDDEIFDSLSNLQPILPNDEVTFFVKDSVKIANLFGKDHNHIRIVLNNGLELKGFFQYADLYYILATGAECEILFTLNYDKFARKVVGIISQIEIVNSVAFDEIYAENFLKGFATEGVEFVDERYVSQTLANDSVLLVFNSYLEYQEAAEKFDLSDFYVSFFTMRARYNKTVLISPISTDGFECFRFVLAFGRYGQAFRRYDAANVIYACVDDGTKRAFVSFGIDRNICATVYRALNSPVTYNDARATYDSKVLTNVSYAQFLASVSVFSELGLIKILPPYSISILPSDKLDLNSSAVYRFFNENFNVELPKQK